MIDVQLDKRIFAVLFLAVLIACTDTNAIQFNFSRQCVEPVGGTLKSIYLESADGKDERYWKAMYDLERLSLDHLKPDMLYRVRSCGGDQGAYTIWLQTDGRGKVVREVRFEDLPDSLQQYEY